MEPLVPASWLADQLGAPDLRVLDASYDALLPGEPPRDHAAEYRAGHVPGALFMDLAGFSDTSSDLPSTMPGAAQFAARAARLGIEPASRIVLYDDAPHHTAARAWVMLRAFGYERVALLDGGLAAWKRAGLPLEQGDGAVPARAVDAGTGTGTAGLRDLAAMRSIQRDGSEQIVDARSAARFTGEEPDPRAGVAPGHMPGARNLPYKRLFDEDGRWKRGEALAAAFRDAGIDLDRPMVMTCGSGITASVLAFGAHLLGRDAAVYDGSWTEWGADPSTPKATGAA
ncbi:sulfurtransferase [Sphingomonas sp. RHCKR7]|uniref:sulfurtransferase n=1 Tax=Sphingomonas folli TaxID=2862497 RepID=UPI001CA5E825|nr:rhodanese-like domain-containing protein [Sphingomonas folli]MBW6527136.1 sulfurtransferase [Sphingomonas folli]